MKQTRLLRITKTSEVRLLGSSDQRRLISIKRITMFDPSLEKVFSEPVMGSSKEAVSWYTDLPGSISSYEELSAEEKQLLSKNWEVVCRKLLKLSDQLDPADRLILENVIQIPSLESLYFIGNELVATEWSAVQAGYRPRNKNIGIDLDAVPVFQEALSDVIQATELAKSQPDKNPIDVEETQSVDDLTVEPRTAPEEARDFIEQTENNRFDVSKAGFFYSLWFWGALFVILCFLNWFLLIDACGVHGIQFLDFCD